MDAVDATPFGAWASIRGYFTPATLFLVLNLVIGTIALTSRSHQRRRRDHLDHAHHHQGQYDHEPLNDPHQQQQEYHYYQHAPAPLARTSSVLDRLRSIGLYRFRSGDFPPEYYGATSGASHDVFAPVVEEETARYARSRSEPAAPVREEEKRAAPRRKRMSSGTEEVVGTSLTRQEPSSPPAKAEYRFQQEDQYVPPPAPVRAPPPLSRTSSVLDRLRSLGLYSFLSAEQSATPDPTEVGDDSKHAHAHYDRSRSEPAREQGKKEEARMGKSSSSAARRKQQPATSSRLAEEDCVDARAEAFIDSFRKEQSQKHAVLLPPHHDDDDVVPPPPAPLARTSSVLDRLRSFGLYLRSGDPGPEDPVKATAADEMPQYGRSRSEPAREDGNKKKNKKKQGGAEARMSKTMSSAEEAVEECVDARADDFINRFRQQLHLQRLNSLLNYREVLNRGGGGGNQ